MVHYPLYTPHTPEIYRSSYMMALWTIQLLWVVTCIVCIHVLYASDLRHQGEPHAALYSEFPEHEYDYSVRRDYLLDKEREIEANNITLTANEVIVDRYLQYKKYEEYLNTRSTGFPPLRPIQEVKDHIEGSDIYRLLKPLPKGGNMHTHENHELARSRLFDILWASEDFPNLWILPETWKLDFFINPPEGENWQKVEGHPTLNRSYIEEHMHLIGVLTPEAEQYPSDSDLRWNLMNTLWGRCSSQLIANIKIKELYLRALYNAALEEGIQYLETRKNFDQFEYIYELSTDPVYNITNGKKYLDTNGELDLQIAMNVSQQYIAEHPEFIGHTRISYTSRNGDHASVQEQMEKAVQFHSQYPKHFKGFDLVAEEDNGRSHLYFLDEYIQLYDPATGESRVPLYLHTGETSFPGDIMTSELTGDLVATAQNTFDAIVLGARRVGHGLAYIKFPYLLQELKNRRVAVEVCPVSNQILGLQADLRSHPAQHYMSMGIPVVLGADDPGSFGVDHITLDWYEVFMGWGLNLKQLKLLAANAINYSALDQAQKNDAITKWEALWDQYITNVTTEACAVDLSTNVPEYYRILPRDGAITGSTNVHVFGRNFERAVCSTVKCMFGAVESPAAHYVSNSHVICTSPAGDGTEQSVDISVSLDNGATYQQTGETFTYKYQPVTMPPTNTIPGDNGDTSVASNNKHYTLYFIVCWLTCIYGLL